MSCCNQFCVFTLNLLEFKPNTSSVSQKHPKTSHAHQTDQHSNPQLPKQVINQANHVIWLFDLTALSCGSISSLRTCTLECTCTCTGTLQPSLVITIKLHDVIDQEAWSYTTSHVGGERTIRLKRRHIKKYTHAGLIF